MYGRPTELRCIGVCSSRDFCAIQMSGACCLRIEKAKEMDCLEPAAVAAVEAATASAAAAAAEAAAEAATATARVAAFRKMQQLSGHRPSFHFHSVTRDMETKIRMHVGIECCVGN